MSKTCSDIKLASAGKNLPGMEKVLIADEDTQLLMILADSLEKYASRFEVITVKNGLEAILAIQKQTFAAVVTEIRMPKVNGLVLMGYLAKNYPDIPCIVMTEVYSENLKKRLEKDSIPYLEKPFKVQNLADVIFSVLERRQTFGGKLKGIPLKAFSLLIENEGISCVCEVESINEGKGYLVFKNGELFNAKLGDAIGEEAAEKILKMKDVTIKYKDLPKKNIAQIVNRKVSELV